MRKTIFLDKEIEVLIVSAGGVGTTFLMKEINKYKRTNCPDNTDGYKHLTIPPISKRRNLKVIYVFGDPIMATLSLFRRSYHQTQSIQMQRFYHSDFVIPMEMTLEEYLDKDKDGLFFERHLKNWQEKYRLHPTLFLKYETLFEHLETIASFIQAPNTFLVNFPEKKERLSALTEISENTKSRLEVFYGNFSRKIAQMPPVEIVDKKAFFILSKKVYVLAIWDAFLKKNKFIRIIWNKLVSK